MIGLIRCFYSLISETLVSVSEQDDAAVGKAVAKNAVLHYSVIAVGVDADVWVDGKAVIHHVAEDVVHIGITAHAVDNVVGERIVKPLAVINVVIRWLGRRQEGEIQQG